MNPFPIEESKVYPAQHHFRIIIHAGSAAAEGLAAVLRDFTVVAPLMPGQASRQGRYQTLQVTVQLGSRDEHLRLDAALRAVEGVRILL